MTVCELYDFLNEYCPFSLAEEWDNPGLNVGRRQKKVERVLVALDVTMETIEAAKAMNADLIITHHPLIFDPPRAINDDTADGARILALAESGMAHIACHTNLDAAQGGVNDCLAAVCGLTEIEPLGNLARIGKTETTLSALAAKLKKELPAENCIGVCCHEKVEKVAVVGGSGGSLLEEVAEAGCDTFVTGEVKYNHLLTARQLGLNVLVLGHYETEYIVLAPLAEALKKAFPALEVAVLPRKSPMECF